MAVHPKPRRRPYRRWQSEEQNVVFAGPGGELQRLESELGREGNDAFGNRQGSSVEHSARAHRHGTAEPDPGPARPKRRWQRPRPTSP